MNKVQKIEASVQIPNYKKIGIYCRVSRATSALLHSLAAQASYLTKYVMRHPGWVLSDIYIDVGSGTKTEGRDEYNRMLSDAKSSLIDIIIVKSISRFGRDAESIIRATRELTDAGAIVYFEEQEISTSSPNSEMYIATYAAIAQAEAKNTSENIKWSIKKKIEDGTSAIYDRPCYGYILNDEGVFEIVESEASIVRKIYNLYLDGYSIVKIKAMLEKEHTPSPTGKSVWSKGTIGRILTNKKYCGFSEAWKYYTTGDGKHRQITNKGEHPRIEMADHHEAVIIPLEIFERVQEMKATRTNIETDESGNTKRKSTKYTSV